MTYIPIYTFTSYKAIAINKFRVKKYRGSISEFRANRHFCH